MQLEQQSAVGEDALGCESIEEGACEEDMLKVKTYKDNQVEDRLLEFAVILSRFQEKWILCRHKERQTWELPGGHREAGETILAAAKRELFEETGALEFELQVICAYSVKDEIEQFGLFCYAEAPGLVIYPSRKLRKFSCLIRCLRQ